MFAELFKTLDLNQDGLLSKADLHAAAKRFGWHWPEAGIFAILDLLTTTGALSKRRFLGYMRQMAEDPLGPYGKVLLNVPYRSNPFMPKRNIKSKGTALKVSHRHASGDSLLNGFVGSDAVKNYRNLLNSLEILQTTTDDAALLIIDPQRSFTKGAWMQSIGAEAEKDIRPVEMAFSKCGELLKKRYGQIETMFTRCPFPPDSYGWDDRLVDIIDSYQLYFIKPGNSVLFPPTNGFRQWVERCIHSGKNILVLGGCTLNSCLRVSSIETLRVFAEKSLQVVVNLSLSGARLRNFIKTPRYNGLSAVESAVRQMTGAGVKVVRQVRWQDVY